MIVTRFADAQAYEAPGHTGVAALRLQGADTSNVEHFTVALSHVLPGGGAEHSASPLERVYVVIAGEATVITDETEVTLAANDSCFIPAGEARTLVNRSNEVATIIVVMPNPDRV
jgi:mannose-6-phosphate isomerase-like protein (cupin superfamily)